MTDEIPAWFSTALAAPAEDGSVDVDGARIRYRAWGSAQNEIMTTDMAQLLRDRLGQAAAVVELPAAGHHVMLDEPLCLVTAMRTLLPGWAIPALSLTPAA
jgi:hypothetical protein